MASKAKKLPSGNWRVQVYDYTDGERKRKYKSFTAATKKEAEYMAAEFNLNKKHIKGAVDITLGEAIDRYIKSKNKVLSPATVREYKRMRKADMQGLMDIKLPKITQEIIQQEINLEATTHSPKSVRNMHGLLSAVLGVYLPKFRINTTLPQKTKPKLNIPTDAAVKQLVEVVKGTDLEVPVLLAAFGPLRRGEICALDPSTDLHGNKLTINKSIVMNDKYQWVTKPPKSFAGNRIVQLPAFVAEKVKEWKPTLNPNYLSKKFRITMKNNNLDYFRFHDLRHYNASILHALNVPDKYIMQRGGWSSSAVLKNVYQHTLDDKQKQHNKNINAYFDKMQHEIQHEK